jgi:hypothetical protein
LFGPAFALFFGLLDPLPKVKPLPRFNEGMPLVEDEDIAGVPVGWKDAASAVESILLGLAWFLPGDSFFVFFAYCADCFAACLAVSPRSKLRFSGTGKGCSLPGAFGNENLNVGVEDCGLLDVEAPFTGEFPLPFCALFGDMFLAVLAVRFGADPMLKDSSAVLENG